MSSERRQVVAEGIADQCHQYGYRDQAWPVKGGDDGCGSSGANIGGRRDRNAVYIDPKNFRAGNTEGAMNENPDKRAEQEGGRLAESG